MSENTDFISDPLNESKVLDKMPNDLITCGIIAWRPADGQLVFNCSLCDQVEHSFESFLQHSVLHLDHLEAKAMEKVCDEIVIAENIEDVKPDISSIVVSQIEDSSKDPFTCLHSEVAIPEPKFLQTATDTQHLLLDLTEEEELEQLDKIVSESNVAKLKKIRRRKPKTKNYKCEICGKAIDCPSTLELHRNAHLGIKPFPCDLCDAKFTAPTNLRHHKKRIHMRMKDYLCHDCGKSFYTSTELATHQRSHTKELPFKCKECPRAFVLQGGLTDHMRRHRNIRPHKCEVCDKRFFDKEQLKKHSVVHTYERPFECLVCNTKFRASSYLKSHMKIHSGLREHACTFCDAQFAQKFNLTAHIRKSHSDK